MAIRSFYPFVNLNSSYLSDDDKTCEEMVHLIIEEQEIVAYQMTLVLCQEYINGQQTNNCFFIKFDQSLIAATINSQAPCYKQLMDGNYATTDETLVVLQELMHDATKECVESHIGQFVTIRHLLSFQL